MNHTAETNTSEMLKKISSIERELMSLKRSVLHKHEPSGKQAVSLRGVIKGLQITDQDIADAKKSLYSAIDV